MLNLDGLEDWELGLLQEMRLLRDAGALEPVLETMSLLMSALMCEGERQAEEKRLSSRMERVRRQKSQKGQLAQAMKDFMPSASSPDVVATRKLVATRTHSGRLLPVRASRFTQEDARWAMFQQIARAANIAAMNRLRSYVNASA
jgi:hypothetical protein